MSSPLNSLIIWDHPFLISVIIKLNIEGPQGHVVAATDRWSLWDVRCYDNAYRAIKFIEIPTVMNKLIKNIYF
jgi:hypothetical protein